MVIGNSTEAQSRFDRAGDLFRGRHIEAALANLNEAERWGYPLDECAAARWECWMLLGKFERAWQESDAIATRGTPDPHRLWDGQPFTGKRVIIRGLHGLGDTIQFIRYAPIIRSTAARVIVETHSPLVRLLQCADGVDQAITWGADAPAIQPEWDSQVEINELPRIFRTVETDIPSTVPYLKVVGGISPESCSRRIGLAWNSGPFNPLRSISIQLLLDALTGLDWNLFSLQFKADCYSLPAVRANDGDVLDAALDMMSMDLIISVDTMTAHLAGALSKPVWVLLPFEADWRWMLNRSDSPWYPTMRLFRQHARGDWSRALQELRLAARAF